MALADDLVEAAARAIRDAYDKDCEVPEAMRPTCDVVEWTPEARAAVAATLRAFVDSGNYPSDRRSIRELADEVERG